MDKYTCLLNQTALDELTGIYNRRYFESFILKEINRSARYGNYFSILLLDIDDFKQVNDTLGHMTGDAVLRELALLLKRYLRAEDIAARYGGEEFIILLPQTDTEGAKKFGRRLLKESAKHTYPGDITVTFSGGVAAYPDHGFTRDDLVSQADRGLYASKLAGKNRISVVNDGRRDSMRYKAGGEFYVSPKDREKIPAFFKDISVTGIAASTNARLQSGDTVYIEVGNEEENSVYVLTARVMWIEEKDPATPLLFGARYEESNKRAVRRLITKFVPENASYC